MKEESVLRPLFITPEQLNKEQQRHLQESGFYNPKTDLYAWVPESELVKLSQEELTRIREELMGTAHSGQPAQGGVLAGLCEDCELPKELCTCHVEEVEGDTPETKTEEDDLDRLVASASTPSLATLFKKGIKAGVLKAQVHYFN